MGGPPSVVEEKRTQIDKIHDVAGKTITRTCYNLLETRYSE